MEWRRERDSNPRYGFPYSSFQDWRLQPLGHLSDDYSFTTVWQFLKKRRAVYLPGFNWLPGLISPRSVFEMDRALRCHWF
jgi:hypothetical protein